MNEEVGLIDIGANLTDGMFSGYYHGKRSHENDLDVVLQRSSDVGVKCIIITAGTEKDTHEALDIIERHQNIHLFTTIGVHPTRCNELDPEPQEYLQRLLELFQKNKSKIIAVGEFGLDYDRLQFCSKEVQIRNFQLQFQLVETTGLPLFLHMRNCCSDFLQIIRENRHRFRTGVVHSFTGTPEDAEEILKLDLYIGIF
jgi:TatD DNase family protein